LFWRWINTIAEVEVAIEAPNKGYLQKKNGNGKAKFHQGWFMGFGPSESME